MELFWVDIKEQEPKVGQNIFYVDTASAEWYEKNPNFSIGLDEIDKGVYMGNELAEWHYDNACEQFRYWFPVPRKAK